MFADQATAIGGRPSLGLLNAVFGKAHALRGDHTTARTLLADDRRMFDRAGPYEQTSDYAVPFAGKHAPTLRLLMTEVEQS
ncbi:hypothetical protein [Streptomyces avidinii]|uniref:Uncharacterized protein n=1 Tax=Streptomyces avidinii TaxID=1895 RepID=A0ABS4KXB5_STRAV|nr:hypothetical protein [Streptomyces avidinii]MBP2034681.1 hypothetical protein [Streptomyces avidinii]GGY88040.1 hypothetical protein GCM10010343_11470 [Streptomyces avidinii]